MNHTEFENEFDCNVKFIFEELNKFVNTRENPKNFEWGSSKRRVVYRNDQDRSELRSERPFIIRLCTMNAKCGQVINAEVRLQALKAAQKKISASVGRHEILLLRDYWDSLLVPALVAFFLITSYLSHFSNDSISTINPFITIITMAITLVLFFLKTLVESTNKRILIVQKRQLELVEQAIELAESRELAKV
jgi:hypothetical protein